jgi:hypothetical protein
MFEVAEAQKMPMLACVGYVEDVGKAAETQSGVYANARVKIKGNSGVSRDITTNLLFRPEWFTPEFHPSQIDEMTFDGMDETETTRIKKGMSMVYRKLFGTRDSLGELPALIGLNGMTELAEKFQALGHTPEAEEIGDILRETILANIVDVGYVLKQAREKTEDLDENGKNIYVLREQYEIDRFFDPSEEGKARQVKSAKKSVTGAFKVAFEF